MTVTQAAKRLGLTRQGVHHLIDLNRLKASRVVLPWRDRYGKPAFRLDIPAAEVRKHERKAVRA